MRDTRTKRRRESARTPSEPGVRQLTFSRRGGARRGAGRKPRGDRPLVSHAAREVLAARHPVLVTLKLQRGLPSLRRVETRSVLHRAFRAGADLHAMRLVHFSIQSNHIHALVEACDERALSRGMQGLAVRIVRGLNRSWGRAGRALADRYHARILRTPREVRYALAYVLCNARKHGVSVAGIDPYSSGASFDGWCEGRNTIVMTLTALTTPVVRARTWLLMIGWRRHGRIEIEHVPGRVRRPAPRSESGVSCTPARSLNSLSRSLARRQRRARPFS